MDNIILFCFVYFVCLLILCILLTNICDQAMLDVIQKNENSKQETQNKSKFLVMLDDICLCEDILNNPNVDIFTPEGGDVIDDYYNICFDFQNAICEASKEELDEFTISGGNDIISNLISKESDQDEKSKLIGWQTKINERLLELSKN